jgi:DUF4097 and DUF4098 domain-containing protein YvlB
VRWRVLALAVILVAPVADRAALTADEIWREQSQKSVEVRGFSSLEIENSRGRVDLVPSRDGRLHITALKIVRVGRKDRPEEVARGIVVEAGQRGDRYRIDVRYQQRRNIRISLSDLFSFDSRVFPHYEVRITAQVPPGLAVVVRETSGDIRSEGIAGPQVLRSTSGDIEVRSAGGRVEASSTSGDVRADGLRRARVSSVSGDLVIQQVAGPLVASTTSGDLRVSGAEDSLVLSTVSGDIHADRAPRGFRGESSSGEVVARSVSGEVRIGTSSGDVTLGLREPLRSTEVSTSSGEIRLSLDPAVGCALELRTSSGSLDVGLPMDMSNVSRRSVAGTIRGGRTPVVLRTASGDITVMGGGR